MIRTGQQVPAASALRVADAAPFSGTSPARRRADGKRLRGAGPDGSLANAFAAAERLGKRRRWAGQTGASARAADVAPAAGEGPCRARQADDAQPALTVYRGTSPQRMGQGAATLVPSWARTLQRRSVSQATRVPAVLMMQLAELPGVALAVFDTRRSMNAAVNRASTFIDEGGRLMSDRETARPVDVGGHCLRVDDLRSYWRAYTPRRAELGDARGTARRAALSLETTFWREVVVPMLDQRQTAVLIAVALDTPIEETLSHELLHAQYFGDSTVRKTVNCYWSDTLAATERALVRELLGELYFECDDASYANELFAYLLQRGPEANLPAAFVAAHRPRLLSALVRAGIAPLQLG